MNTHPQPEPILSLSGICKSFGATRANQDIHMDVFPGEIHAILGENGAGKSTLMSILSGRLRPDSGNIRLEGRRVKFASPAQAMAAGIGMVYQRFMLVESLTVTENILLGLGRGRLRLNIAQAQKEIRTFAGRYDLEIDPAKTVSRLSMGERQRVEILKLLYRRARILIFDEPTAVLSPPEIETFFSILRKLTELGHTILFITHKLEEVMALARRISILRRGKMVASFAAEQVRSRRELARLMVGREILLKVDRPAVTPGETVFAVRDLSARTAAGQLLFRNIDLQVRRGEILAVTGVAGNGQGPLTAALAGLLPDVAGSVDFLDRTWAAAEWPRAPRKEMVYIPEDRHSTASVPGLSLVDNFMLTRLGRYHRGPLLSFSRARRETAQALAAFSVQAPAGPDTTARQLSGGNLQKFVLSRELAGRPALIIAEQPTSGLDIGATEEVWKTLLAQRRHSAVLLVSGDLREVLSLADRVAVIYRGQVIATVSARDDQQAARVGLLMAGIRD
jgi:simple sugar transport system ATP-binding protein